MVKMSNELTVQSGNFVSPATSMETAVARYRDMSNFIANVLRDGTDYGKIPGAGDKPTLLKPGAEKLASFFGLASSFTIIDKEQDWTGQEHGGEPFFYYWYKCILSRNGNPVAEGEGSANSFEKKYRWRSATLVCPKCGAEAIIKGKDEYGGGWLCFAKKGGCGAKFKDGDQSIESQPRGQVQNPDIADVVNTLQKMAQKRALVAAVLIGTNASDYFTQDVEDMSFGSAGIIDGEFTEIAAVPEKPQAKPKPAAKPKAEPKPEPEQEQPATFEYEGVTYNEKVKTVCNSDGTPYYMLSDDELSKRFNYYEQKDSLTEEENLKHRAAKHCLKARAVTA
jgi:hypothetical protein